MLAARDGDAPGVNHRLVLDACHIITNHAAEERGCYLSRDYQGQVPVMSPGHLGAGAAFFQDGRQLPNRHRYPAKGPPDHWRRPENIEKATALAVHRDDRCDEPGEFRLTVALDDRDVGCVVTKQHGGIDVIRLVPLDHEDWFKHHDMGRYNIAGHGFDADSFSGRNEFELDNRGINDPANGFFLRRDVADLLKQHSFVFFPAGLGDCKFQFMTYMCGGPLD
ncbi:hypothetical protein V8D89_012834 [Ganoderma adspersum]